MHTLQIAQSIQDDTTEFYDEDWYGNLVTIKKVMQREWKEMGFTSRLKYEDRISILYSFVFVCGSVYSLIHVVYSVICL